MGTSEIPKLTFFKTELDNHSSKISKIEWNTYFDWYFEASKCYQQSENCLHNTIINSLYCAENSLHNTIIKF